MSTKREGAMSESGSRLGHFCWTDLGVSAPGPAKAFYSQVMGWQGLDYPIPQGGDYTLFRADGRDACGLYELSPDQRAQKVPPHWLVYVTVDDAEATARRAKALGGRIVVDAYDVVALGRMAILIDPTGAMFALWEKGTHAGMSIAAGEPGSLCWCELMTPNLNVAASFYAELFGWTVEIEEAGAMRHARCRIGDMPIADLMAIASSHGRVPPHWLAYFAVDDCMKANERIAAAGGRTLVAPAPLSGGSVFAIARDPEGAVFGIMGHEAPTLNS